MVVDPAGNVTIAGNFLGSIDFGDGPLTSAGGLDIYVAKFDSAGGLVWKQGFGDNNAQQLQDMALDAAGNLVIVGGFAGSVNFGDQALTNDMGQDIFISKLATDTGTALWSRQYGSGEPDSKLGVSVALDASSNIAVAGIFSGT